MTGSNHVTGRGRRPRLPYADPDVKELVTSPFATSTTECHYSRPLDIADITIRRNL
jgi:hypothetical protein